MSTSSGPRTDAPTSPAGKDQSRVTVRYWAAAKAAAGVEQEDRPVGTVAQVLAGARADHPELERVLAVATVLLDGVPARDGQRLEPGSTLEVLPPFAGG
ncbi:molybdopterin converting factor small subunit [Kineosphaera limosa]|uniref:MoaD/ThiS family protein n=1 Tax=Kineosphaera limosa TaxID=111564 RepID=UPI001837E412|nr:MoaD/ThiS family protein [Kineosphaera limosa]NYD99751.1 molybdopterin converting factor small subunit [Kineosphaera limosa]